MTRKTKCADIFIIRIHETVHVGYLFIKCSCQQTKSPQIKSWRFFSLCYLLAIASNCTGTLPIQQRKSIQISCTSMCSYTHCVYNKVRVRVIYTTYSEKRNCHKCRNNIQHPDCNNCRIVRQKQYLCKIYLDKHETLWHCDHGILQCKFECTKSESTQNSHNVLSRTFWVKTGVRENGWR